MLLTSTIYYYTSKHQIIPARIQVYSDSFLIPTHCLLVERPPMKCVSSSNRPSLCGSDSFIFLSNGLYFYSHLVDTLFASCIIICLAPSHLAQHNCICTVLSASTSRLMDYVDYTRRKHSLLIILEKTKVMWINEQERTGTRDLILIDNENEELIIEEHRILRSEPS